MNLVCATETGQGWWTEGPAGLRADPGGMPQTVVAYPVTAREGKGPNSDSDSDSGNLVLAHTLRAEGHDASEDSTGRGTPLIADTLRSHPRPGSNSVGALAFNWQSGGDCRQNPSEAATDALSGSQVPAVAFAATNSAVRRLSVTECERLMGFDDGWTLHGKREDGTIYHQADAPRYRQLGNAVCPPVIEWIGRRIMAQMRSAVE